MRYAIPFVATHTSARVKRVSPLSSEKCRGRETPAFAGQKWCFSPSAAPGMDHLNGKHDQHGPGLVHIPAGRSGRHMMHHNRSDSPHFHMGAGSHPALHFVVRSPDGHVSACAEIRPIRHPTVSSRTWRHVDGLCATRSILSGKHDGAHAVEANWIHHTIPGGPCESKRGGREGISAPALV